MIQLSASEIKVVLRYLETGYTIAKGKLSKIPFGEKNRTEWYLQMGNLTHDYLSIKEKLQAELIHILEYTPTVEG